MSAYIAGIDHLLIDVPDLDAAASAWRRLGFRPTPPGRHPQWGTGNVCLMLERDYVELIGIVDRAAYQAGAARRSRRLGAGGLAAIALAAADVEGARAELAEAGIEAEAPRELARRIDGADGGEPRFLILDLPAEASPAIPMFLCRHLTPELVRRPGWTRHDNGARRIVGVALAVDDPPALAAPYEALFGPGVATRTDGLLSLYVGGATILFARADELAALYPGLLPEPGAAAMPAVATIEVAALDQAAAALRGGNIPFERHSDGLQVAAGHASGVALVLRAGA